MHLKAMGIQVQRSLLHAVSDACVSQCVALALESRVAHGWLA